MTMYDQGAQSQLKEKLEYELWLLDFLYKTLNIFKGGTALSEYTVVNRKPGASIAIKVGNGSGSETTLEIMARIMPLTFTASYKILDMIFEWILEENQRAGIAYKIPPKFQARINLIKRKPPTYPSLFKSEPHIKNYLFELYSQLLKFRNGIIHNTNVSVKNGKLKVDTVERGQSDSLEIDQIELGFFVRTVTSVANLLTGTMRLGKLESRQLKYHLDRIEKFHKLPKFGQEKPLLITIKLMVQEEEGVFRADVKHALKETSGGPHDIVFNLKVIGLVDDKPSECWFFRVDDVPKDDVLKLRPDSYPEHKIAPNEVY